MIDALHPDRTGYTTLTGAQDVAAAWYGLTLCVDVDLFPTIVKPADCGYRPRAKAQRVLLAPARPWPP
jgi:hypothetical protein